MVKDAAFSRSRSRSRFMMSMRSPLIANSLHSADGKKSVAVPGQQDTRYGVLPESDAYDAILANKPKMGVPDFQEIAKKQEQGQLQYSEKCSLKFQVIDDTALIEYSSLVGRGKFTRNRQESNKGRKPKRKVGKGRRKKDTLEEEKMGKKRGAYSRKEMESLRFENLEDQKKKWAEVYFGLHELVAEEYDGLVNSATVHH